MSRACLLRCSVAAALSLTPCMAAAQAQGSGDTPAIDPDAVTALNKMGAALRALTNIDLHTEVTTEEVLTTGQKLQFGGTVDVKATRPNRLRVDIISDRQTRTLYYDGQSATLFAPKLGYFATFPAAPTIHQMLDNAAERYDLEVPMADLFAWGEDPNVTKNLKSAFRVGTETINGQTCEQYAMRQEDTDWQVWIRQGDNALPCKLVITTTDDPSMPQYSAVYTWKPPGSFAADTFTFTPPANSRRIAIGQVPATSAPGGGN